MNVGSSEDTLETPSVILELNALVADEGAIVVKVLVADNIGKTLASANRLPATTSAPESVGNSRPPGRRYQDSLCCFDSR